MRKLFSYFLVALAAITLTTSCSNDDEPEINTEDTDDIRMTDHEKLLSPISLQQETRSGLPSGLLRPRGPMHSESRQPSRMPKIHTTVTAFRTSHTTTSVRL